MKQPEYTEGPEGAGEVQNPCDRDFIGSAQKEKEADLSPDLSGKLRASVYVLVGRPPFGKRTG